MTDKKDMELAENSSLAFVVTKEFDRRPGAEVAEAASELLGTRAEVEAELDLMFDQIRKFYMQEPDQVMRVISALSARASELWVNLHRVEGRDRSYKQIRTLQVTPLIEELDRQFKLASRIVEVRRQDLDLLK
jgi:hypothetical protein